jgi:hypothetical protein
VLTGRVCRAGSCWNRVVRAAPHLLLADLSSLQDAAAVLTGLGLDNEEVAVVLSRHGALLRHAGTMQASELGRRGVPPEGDLQSLTNGTGLSCADLTVVAGSQQQACFGNMMQCSKAAEAPGPLDVLCVVWLVCLGCGLSASATHRTIGCGLSTSVTHRTIGCGRSRLRSVCQCDTQDHRLWSAVITIPWNQEHNAVSCLACRPAWTSWPVGASH